MLNLPKLSSEGTPPHLQHQHQQGTQQQEARQEVTQQQEVEKVTQQEVPQQLQEDPAPTALKLSQLFPALEAATFQVLDRPEDDGAWTQFNQLKTQVLQVSSTLVESSRKASPSINTKQ